MWQIELSKFLRTPADLVAAGLISESLAASMQLVSRKYRIAISPYYASLIDKGNPHCPIFLQSVPRQTEDTPTAGFTEDPLEDARYQVAPRLTHRLRGRALLHVTASCSMYCRFCFRKALLNESAHTLFSGNYGGALTYLQQHAGIEEIILTGGDPLMLEDKQLHSLLAALTKIETIRKLRIHTRVPVTFPIRIDESCLRSLNHAFDRKVIVVHFNHPKELTEEALSACARLQRRGYSVWNQSVLLKGVNDEATTLCALFERLLASNITPYYLHHPDRAQGTAHYYLRLEEGWKVFSEVKRRMPGSRLPRYVIDVLGAEGKKNVESMIGP